MKKIQKKKTLRRIAFLSLSVVVFSNADENDSPRKLFLSLSLSQNTEEKRDHRETMCSTTTTTTTTATKNSLSRLSRLSLSLDFSSRLI
jgi:hypothetical protein